MCVQATRRKSDFAGPLAVLDIPRMNTSYVPSRNEVLAVVPSYRQYQVQVVYSTPVQEYEYQHAYPNTVDTDDRLVCARCLTPTIV